MFSPIILTIVSTTIVGGILYIVFNLILNSNFDDDKQKSDKSVTNEFVDNRPQETEKCLVDDQNESKIDPKRHKSEDKFEEVIKSCDSLETKKTDLSSNVSLDNEVLIIEDLDQTNEQIGDENQDLLDLDFEEIIKEVEDMTYEPPVEREVTDEVVVKDVIQITENVFKLGSDTDKNEELIVFDKDVNGGPIERQESRELKDEFWSLEDTQNLKHLNKSRPKKHKSRPSIKVVFTEEPTDHNSELQLKEDPISKSAKELVDNLFENLDSDLQEYNNRTDSAQNDPKDEELEERTIFESEVCETTETKISKNDDTFEEIASGEYKKFDEFSDFFRSETRKHEMSRKVYEISSVKSFEITVDSSEPLNQEMIDNLLKNFKPNDNKSEVFEENYSKVTESESIEVRKGDKTTEVIPIRNNESVSHTKSFGERSLSNTSLSKMSLEDLNLNMRSSKSRLSETIDSVTKPLLSSPTLFRRSLFAADEEPDYENGVNETPNRTQLPLFGRSQSLLMKEMKEKEFRKSLKPFNDFTVSDKNISNE